MEDLSRFTLRELLTLARERLGTAASGLKTRDELVGALTTSALPPIAQGVGDRPVEAREPVVTRDFFKRRP